MKSAPLAVLVLLTGLFGTALLAAHVRHSPDAQHHASAMPAPVSKSSALFRDVSQEAGLRFTLGHGGRSPLTILETLGGGCAFLDYDNDGWQDILLVGPDKVALYRNNHNGTFTDVTADSGLKQQGPWQGVATGDYDNDGKIDVLLTGYRCCALYHNEGHGRFRDVTKQAGLESNLWGTSACFLDIDNDGRLDLYVAHYVKFYLNSTQYCYQAGVKAACGPTTYDPEIGTLYHNNGDGTFTDDTAKRGLADAHGNALGVAMCDYDNDGWMDFAVANDQTPGDLYHNKGKGFFENAGLMSGTAYDVSGAAHAGMGLDWADFDADGKFALVVTTYQHQPKSLYRQAAPGQFVDACNDTGIGQATINNVGFGVKFLDYDNDGLPDVVIANGHAVDNIKLTDRTTDYPQLPQLFHNTGNGRLEEVTAIAGPDFQRPVVGRGLAVGDFDNDGRLDILLMDIEGHPLLLHNECHIPNHWLTLKLQGTRSNRDGIGARIRVRAGGRTWQQTVTTGGSFLSASDVRAHLGLGASQNAERVEIHWPSGHNTVLTDVAADRSLTVSEDQQ